MPRLMPAILIVCLGACAGRARFGAGPVVDSDGRLGARVSASFAFGVQETEEGERPHAFERLLSTGLALDAETDGQPVLLRSHLTVEQNWRSPAVGLGLGAGISTHGVGHRAFGPALSLRAARPIRSLAGRWTSLGGELFCDMVIVRGAERRKLGSCALLAVVDDGAAQLDTDANSGDDEARPPR